MMAPSTLRPAAPAGIPPFTRAIVSAVLRPLARALRVPMAFVVADPGDGSVLVASFGPVSAATLGIAGVREALRAPHAVVTSAAPGSALGPLRYFAASGLWAGSSLLSLCVADGAPRGVREEDVRLLRAVAADMERSIEAATEAAEAERLALFDDAAVGVIVHDADGHVVGWNESACGILGLSPAALRVRSPFDGRWRMTREDGTDLAADEHPAAVARLTGREGKHVVMALHRGDGPPTWLSVSARCRPSSKASPPHRTTVTFIDLTPMRSADLARLASEERYRLVYDQSLDGILYTSPTGEIYAANPAACAMVGLTEEEIVRRGRGGVVDASDPALHALVARRQKDRSARGEFRMLRRDGTPFPVEATSAIFLDAEGRERTCLTVRDISERRALERRLATAETRLRESSGFELREQIGQLLLGARLAASELRRDAPPHLERGLDVLDGIVADAMGRVSALARSLAVVALPVATLGEALRALGARASHARGVDCRFTLEPDGNDGDADVFTKQQVLLVASEAIDNACRHGRCDLIDVRLVFGPLCSLHVRDDGIGIAESPPVGVGMLGMRHRAALLGGSVTVEARRGRGERGTEVTLTWPSRVVAPRSARGSVPSRC